jgi:hypothetical protein
MDSEFLNPKDQKILNVLKDNARASIREIAKRKLVRDLQFTCLFQVLLNDS